jgi:hypothetical protein
VRCTQEGEAEGEGGRGREFNRNYSIMGVHGSQVSALHQLRGDSTLLSFNTVSSLRCIDAQELAATTDSVQKIP